MEIYQDIEINKTIENSLKRSINYSEYRKLVEELVVQKSTTGNDKTEDLAEYTKLNARRMKRWDKTLKISKESQELVAQNQKEMTWLVLTESWCGDAAHVIPVINKVADLNDNIDLRLIMRDEHEDLMNAYLTNGSKSIPKLIAIDKKTGNVISTFGPRPSEATKLVEEYKLEHGSLTPEFKQDLQVWYNKDKGQTTISDLEKLLKD
ncbi:MAG: thioredoxin family protein [Flavobacteriaceae bacterium]|nr:thioredoxin family protein [Bacteroidia bacterium]NNL16461.1 thioredoxin family protein [Flavobacteriaceae bacterium]